MAKFRFRGRNQHGILVHGEREFNRVENLVEQLNEEGITPIDIKAADEETSFFKLSTTPSKVKHEEMLIFCRQLYSLLRAGVSLVPALTQLSELTRNQLLVKTIIGVRDKISMGEGFSTAISHYPKVFSNIVVSLVAAGEVNGRLDEAFALVSSHLELQNTTRKKVKEALRYPITVMFVAAGAVTTINMLVVPQFASMFASFNAPLPLPTRILIGSSNFMLKYWPYLLGTILSFVFGFKFLNKKPKFNLVWSRYRLKLPIFGPLAERILMAGFARTLSMLLKSGVTLTQAIHLVSKVVNNSYAEQRVLMLSTKIENGESLSQAAKEIDFFPPLVLQMLNVGEETGNTDRMLAEVAQLYEEEVDFDLKQMAARMEPILIMIVAGVVLVLALGVFLPMWDMTKYVK